MDNVSIISLLTKETFTNVEVSEPCPEKNCGRIDFQDYTFLLNQDLTNEDYLRPTDFH